MFTIHLYDLISSSCGSTLFVRLFAFSTCVSNSIRFIRIVFPPLHPLVLFDQIPMYLPSSSSSCIFRVFDEIPIQVVPHWGGKQSSYFIFGCLASWCCLASTIFAVNGNSVPQILQAILFAALANFSATRGSRTMPAFSSFFLFAFAISFLLFAILCSFFLYFTTD